MVSLPEGFGQLVNLQVLYLNECTSLVSLPKRFGELKSLTHRSTGADDCTPLDDNGDPLLTPVYLHMLTHNETR